jgi:hypothetical protein
VDFGFQSVLRVSTSAGGTVTGLGINCPPACSFTFDSSMGVTLTANADPNFVFSGWGGDCGGTSGCSFGMSSDHNVSALFQLTAPTQLTPADGARIRANGFGTAVASLTWTTVGGATEYELETTPTLLGRPNGPPVRTRVSGTQFTYQWGCDTSGLSLTSGAIWRVAAVASDGTVGLMSGSRSFFCDASGGKFP